MNDTDETTESKGTAEDVTHPETAFGVSSETAETIPESGTPAPGKRLPRGAWHWFAGAAVLVFAGLLCLREKDPGPKTPKNVAEIPADNVPTGLTWGSQGIVLSGDEQIADVGPGAVMVSGTTGDSVLGKRINEIKSGLEELRKSVEKLAKAQTSSRTTESPSASAVETARKLAKAGKHEQAGYYWRNAVEHASDEELLSVLQEYADAFFKAKTEDSEARYAEAATLERLAELALVRIPPEEMDKAFELRAKCAKFRSDLFAETEPEVDPEAENEPEAEPEPIAKTVADSAKKLLDELEREITNYSGPSKDRTATEEECLILQLSGVAESTISQLWFLDRSGLDETETKRMDAFPKRLADLVDRFNEKHDAPIVTEIRDLASAKPNKSYSYAPHQRNVDFYTNQVALATAAVRHLRGTDAQTIVQKSIASIMEKVTDEKRQQMNEYQKFVANCCKRSFDCYDPLLGATSLEYGRVPKKAGYKDEDDFIDRKIRSFSQSVSLDDLRSQTDWRKIFANDTLVSQSLMTKSGGQAFFDVANHHKSFIILAINGMFRIDQSLLSPETSRMLNDVFDKFRKEMKPADQVKFVRWMVEEPKIRLEDF